MTYKINKTDGTLLVEIPDGSFNVDSTSITLIGKNVTSFGESINENLVKMLENFASTTQPEHAIKGQLWFNTTNNRIYVYNGTEFRASGAPLIGSAAPQNLVAGDLWINNETNQLWFYDGTDLILAGPVYTNDQGRSGFVVETILDSYSRSHVICLLYVSNTLIGIFSKDEFTPKFPVTGYGPSGKIIKVGFNAGELSGIKFNVTATTSESILLDDGVTAKTAAEIVFKNEENVLTQPLTIQANNSLVLGGAEQVQIKLVSDNLYIEQQLADKDISLRVKSGGVTRDGVTVKGSGRVGIFNNNPQYTLDVAGSVYISGDLIVGGTNLTVNTTTVEVEDKNIVIGKTDTPTDTTADGGGITLKGTSDKTISYTDDSKSWDFSENLKIAPFKEFRIGTNTVLTANTLGSSVVNSSLTSLGALSTLNLANGLNITESTITTSSGNLTLNPTLNIDASNKKIVNVADPVDLTDAANKEYVNNFTFSRPMFVTLDTTGLATNAAIATILNKLIPFFNETGTPEEQAGYAINGTKLRVHTTKTVVVNSQQAPATLNVVTGAADKDGTFSSLPVVTSVAANAVEPSLTTVSVIRQTKLFIMTSGSWVFDSDLEAPYTT